MKRIFHLFLGAAAALAPAPAAPLWAGETAADVAAPPSPAEVDRLLGKGAAAIGRGAAPDVSVAPFTFEGGHIIVNVTVDGQAARPFIFDTGALTTLTRDAARELHLTLEGDTSLMGGIGSHLVGADTAIVDTIAIGGVTLEHQKVHVAALRNVLIDRGARPQAAGLLGSELLHSYVVRIDYANSQLTLIPAGAFRPPADGFALPLTVSVTREGLAQALLSAEIEHVPARFIVDTGAGGQLHLTARFEGEHRLVAHYPKTVEYVSTGGIGGHARTRVGLGESFVLGPMSFSTPFVSTPADDGTPEVVTDTSPPANFARRYRPKPDELGALFFSDGLLGNGVLAHFIVTLDYKSGHIYFEAPRGKVLSTGWNGTGIIIDKPEHESFEIIDILPGSAAERAGLHRGDRIVAVDNVPARDLSAGDFSARNAAIAHRTVAVETSDGKHVDVAIGRLLP
jgi:Aspartyl protease/PDZ domain